MPLFDYACENCGHSQEHFIFNGGNFVKTCPECGSEDYAKQLPTFQLEVEYSNSKERYDKKIMPGVKETYEQIGKEALRDDTKTLDNVFGKQKVEGALGK